MGVVETRQGKLEGYEKHGLQIFKGVPFAKPPIGQLRFRAPEPPDRWAGVREAKTWGGACPQPKIDMVNVGHRTEDCLYLNIWTPGCDGGKRPVMVWIHGGAYVMGSTAQGEYNAKHLVANGDVVVVSTNYRLGALGFSFFNDLLGEEAQVASNAGTRDLIAALGWVRENIAAFGGDPDDVTIFGESAGGMCVTTLLGSERTGGLFHKAIAQSGAGHHHLDRETASGIAKSLLDTLGIDPKRPRALWELDARVIVKAQAAVQNKTIPTGPARLPMAGMPFIPTVDGDLLPKGSWQAIRDGVGKNTPLMLGTARDEFRLFTTLAPLSAGLTGGIGLPQVTDQNLFDIVEAQLPGRSQEAVRLYRELLPGKPASVIFSAIETDRTFAAPAFRLADAHARHGSHTYAYRIDFRGSMGACHAIDVPLVFGDVDNAFGRLLTGGGARARSLSHKMQHAWLAFAESGSPACPELPTWPAFQEPSRATMIFDEECVVQSDPWQARREFWDQILPR